MTDLASRLLDHAAIHDRDLAHDRQQRQWAEDLREAARIVTASEGVASSARGDCDAYRVDPAALDALDAALEGRDIRTDTAG